MAITQAGSRVEAVVPFDSAPTASVGMLTRRRNEAGTFEVAFPTRMVPSRWNDDDATVTFGSRLAAKYAVATATCSAGVREPLTPASTAESSETCNAFWLWLARE